MKIAIIDDEQKEREYLLGVIESQLSAHSCTVGKIDTFGSAEEFLDAWIPHSYGLILLDIYMDDMDGIDTARKIRERDREAMIVFCTSGNEFASESYEVGARYYLRKPVSEKGVKAMLDRLNLDEYELNRFLVLPDGQQMILRNIIYTEYYNHVVTIHNKKGADIRTRISQQAKEHDIDFTVHAALPEETGIAGSDLSVILGNLLENAVDACAAQKSKDRRIVFRGKADRSALYFTIDNTMEGELRRDKEGRLLSVKHEGPGLGLESVRDIVSRYNGVLRTEQKGDVFCASVFLNI